MIFTLCYLVALVVAGILGCLVNRHTEDEHAKRDRHARSYPPTLYLGPGETREARRKEARKRAA